MPTPPGELTGDERALADAVLAGRGAVVNVRKADRAGMVARYAAWLDDRPDLLGRIAAGELTGRALGCWCAPLACHADVLLDRTRRPATGGARGC